jgi:hypothetical protein
MHCFRRSLDTRNLSCVLLAITMLAVGAAVVGCTSHAETPSQTAAATHSAALTSSVTASATPVATAPVPPSSASSQGLHERPALPKSTAPRASATAEGAVRAWYLAWFAGDMDAAKRTSTESFAVTISEHTFEGGDVTDYKLLGTEGAMGTTAFYIRETRQDAPQRAMTVLVVGRDSGNGYLVSGYEDTPADTVPASPARPDGSSAVGRTAAVAAVTGSLQALTNDDVEAAKAFATTRFVKANPSWFSPASGALTQFSVVSALRRHDVWVVQVTETWRAETFPTTYVVQTVSGKARVDRVKGWY